MGRDEGKGTRGFEALYFQTHPAPAPDYAGYPGDLNRYLTDASGFTGYADRIAVPDGEAELLELIAGTEPLTLSGGRTGVAGGAVPFGGTLVSLEKFTRLDIHPGLAIVGAGVLLKDLHAAAQRSGQFYPPDPTETWASLGGTIATNASGSRSFLYGATRRHVKSLRVALMDGRILTLHRGEKLPFAVPALPVPRTTKHTAGYFLRDGMDAVDLFIGSEGTLGIVLEAELNLLPEPVELLSAVVFFAHDALNAVDAWRSAPRLRMLEYLDRATLRLLRTKYPEIPGEAAAALLIEQESPGDEDWERWSGEGALEASWFGTGAADRERFRQFRHAIPEMVNDTVRRNGFTKLGSDFAVPLERSREMLAVYRHECEAIFPGQYVIFGHIGDAHLHVNLLPAGENEAAKARELLTYFAREAVRLGGTVSAEHGLGKRKKHLLPIEFSEPEIEIMREVKRLLDPEWRLGEGTLFDKTPATAF